MFFGFGKRGSLCQGKGPTKRVGRDTWEGRELNLQVEVRILCPQSGSGQ